MLDPNGLSNWTDGAEVVAFGCLPGYFLDEGDAGALTSFCISGEWDPQPPVCVSLQTYFLILYKNYIVFKIIYYPICNSEFSSHQTIL